MAKVLKIKEWMEFRNDFIIPMAKVRRMLVRPGMNKGVFNYCKNGLESVAEKIDSMINYIDHIGIKINLDDKTDIQYLPPSISIDSADTEEANKLIQYYNYITERGNHTLYLYSTIKW